MLKSARTEVAMSVTECLEHADSGMVEDSVNSSPDLTTSDVVHNVPEELQEDHSVCKPQLPHPATISSLLPARHVDVLASSLAATHSDQACLVSEVLNRVPAVTTH